MKQLTYKQQKYLDFIDSFCKENGYSPSVREIAAGLGIVSTSAVQNMIERLYSRGLLNKGTGVARTVSLTLESQHEEERGIPILGRIKAGMPVEVEENIEGYIPVHDFLRTSSGGFFLIVEGDSMIEKGIVSGDYAFIKPQKEISNGQIGAFRINGEVTLKTFRRKDGRITLLPANEEYNPIEIAPEDDFEVIGRFVMLLRLVEKGYDKRFC